jgi:hypothetical protein
LQEIRELWRSYCYNFTEEILTNFLVSANNKGKLFVNFEKNGKIKQFNLPQPQNKTQKQILREFRENLNF